MIAPYGTWISPFTAEMVAGGSTGLGEPRVEGDRIFWLEARPKEEGRVVLVVHEKGTTRDVTPKGFSVRTRVHEYGGGSYVVDGDIVYFSNWADQRIYRQELGSDPVPFTPEPPSPSSWRFADALVLEDGIVCVRERHEDGDVINELVFIDESGESIIIVTGHDFFSSPRVSPDGQKIAWLCWDHPNMPWDGTELWTGDYEGSGVLGVRRRVTGGRDESIVQPEFGPTGGLYWLSDRSNYWNLYQDKQPIAPMDHDCAGPAWTLGGRYYGLLADGRIVMTINEDGFERLVLRNPDGEQTPLDVSPGTHRGAFATDGELIVVLSGDASTRAAVRVIDPASGSVDTLRRAGGFDAAYVSQAQPIEFMSEEGPSHAFFYPPSNPDFEGLEEDLPPLIVFSHGGPTSAAKPDLDPEIQFFTSRGIAVVDVNYGGSTGYGRRYRQRLSGMWGIVDVRDCINAARHLASEGLVDGARLAIRGGSAGGFTTLAALTFHDVFKVGASYYGVGDLEALARETHKFESRYLDHLVGTYPEALDLYRQRSPINFTDQISCPIILFQGLEDEVVAPSQALAIIKSLATRGIPHEYVFFQGEQHGFRRAENIARAIGDELLFFGWVLGFEPVL
jgi:dipeptidyl aminopeptidase/acylaminoacyl peptidase